MSRQTARIALDQMAGRPALIAPQYAESVGLPEVTSNGMLSDLRELAAADLDREQGLAQKRKSELAAIYGFTANTQDKPFAFANGKAIIPIHGILINRFAYSWSFVTGYNFIRSQVAAAMADEDVDGIIYDVNSYGGMCAGCSETADMVFAASQRGGGGDGGKPSIAVVDANCYSAAYMIASAADKIVVTPSGGAGSIGVVLMHMDVSAALEKFGVKISFIHAGAHKTDGNPYEPLSDEVRAEFQADIDAIYDTFVSAVVRGRGIPDQAVRDTEARCYRADEALTRGLIDAVQTPNDAVEGYFNADEPDEPEEGEPADPDNDEEPDMATASNTPKTDAQVATTNAAGAASAQPDLAAQAAANAATAAAEARAAERSRIQGIQAHAEAAGRETLAAHLALNTDLSVEAAAGILAASPKKEAAAPVQTAGQEGSHFQNAMNNGRHPDVGAGAAAGQGEETNLTPAQRILAAQSRATGARPSAKPN